MSPQIGVIDALTTGLRKAANRPWLVAIPALVDLGLWLAPRLSVKELMQRGGLVLEGLFRAAYANTQPAGIDELLALFRESIQQLSASLNLANVIGGHWIALPSALMSLQPNRLTILSDGVLAPVGIGVKLTPVAAAPWRGAPIEIHSIWAALAILLGLWLVGHLLAALYLRLAAESWLAPANVATGDQAATPATPAPAVRWRGLRGLLALTLRFVLLSLLIGAGVFLIFIPLVMATSIATFLGSVATGIAFALTGGITLWILMWFLTSAFFTSEALLLDGSSLLGALGQSAVLVRRSGLRTLSLVAVINLLMLGFRAAWGLLGQTPVAVVAASVGNAYLATGMLLAIFAYYDGLRKAWVMANKSRSMSAGQS